MHGKPKKHVLVCVQHRAADQPRSPGCGDRGGAAVYKAFLDEFQNLGLWDKGYLLTDTGCMGPCDRGPTVVVYPEGVMYLGVRPEDARAIVDEHLLFDQPVARLLAPPEIW